MTPLPLRPIQKKGLSMGSLFTVLKNVSRQKEENLRDKTPTFGDSV